MITDLFKKQPISFQSGSRVRLSGGYDMEPPWLNGRESFDATVRRFIPGQNKTPALLVETDEPISFEEVKGSILVLELRYVGATWTRQNIVHLELCDFDPPDIAWKDRRQGKWIESHATCTIVDHTHVSLE